MTTERGVIRPYTDADERGWLECRVLAFLDSAYYDAVERKKEHYERPSVELVAEAGGRIVGLIDVELEEEPGTVCEDRPGLGGMIWHLAVLPEHRRLGIASDLLAVAEAEARTRGVERFEAWTRDDPWVQAWYEAQGFEQILGYLHVYVHGREETQGVVTAELGLNSACLWRSRSSPRSRPDSRFVRSLGMAGGALRTPRLLRPMLVLCSRTNDGRLRAKAPAMLIGSASPL